MDTYPEKIAPEDTIQISVPWSQARTELGGIILFNSYNSDAYVDAARNFGIEVLAPGDQRRPEYKCAQYVFATDKQETWINADQPAPDGLFWNTIEFLSEKGYRILTLNDEIQDGDVVAYWYYYQSEPPVQMTLHFGVWSQGQVISKWNSGPIVKHGLATLPALFGDWAYILRKS